MRNATMKRESKRLLSLTPLALTVGMLCLFHMVESSKHGREGGPQPQTNLAYPVSSANRMNHSHHHNSHGVKSSSTNPENSSSISHSSVRPSSAAAQKPKRAHFDPLSFYSDRDIDNDFDPTFIPPNFGIEDPDAISDDEPLAHDPNNPQQPQHQKYLPHSPVIYRYYGKSRSRTRASGSIPFILLGPNVEHWKRTGEHLAARGFSVIACERDPLEPKEEVSSNSQEGPETTITNNNNPYEQQHPSNWVEGDWRNGGNDNEGANLVLNVLRASRWSKAILVACDSEAVIAIQAAMKLAPDKIAGVVLCGDLREVDSLLLQSNPELKEEGPFAMEAFLKQFLPCPFAIACGEGIDHNAPFAANFGYDASSPAECLHGNRCFILGGGIAPHRLQPETFAWTLTRFCEDKVASSIPITERKRIFPRINRAKNDDGARLPLPSMTGGLFHKLLRGDYFSIGSFVVYGRVIASVIFYATLLKVGVYQYGNIVDGMVNVKSGFDMLKELPRKFLKLLSGFFLNYGYISRLFRRRKQDPDASEADDLLEKDKLDEREFQTVEEEEGPQEVPGEEEEEEVLEEPTDSTHGEDSENDELENEGGESDDASPELPEKEQRRRFGAPPFFLLDRVIASADSTTLLPGGPHSFRG